MLGEHGDRWGRKTEWGWGVPEKWRPWARVMLMGTMEEDRDNRASVRAQRKASKWRQQKSSAASVPPLYASCYMGQRVRVSRSCTASEYPPHCLSPSPVSLDGATPLSGVFLTPSLIFV